ncbi:MAG: glucokinase [Gammaproteobacteria bacterium]|nr:MAG: glucokinase [Gammaproteobacteria bacterium]
MAVSRDSIDAPVSAEHRPTPRLVGDVGGTNARFALLDEDDKPFASSTLSTDDFPDLASAVKIYLAEHENTKIDVAAIAVATPVTGDRVNLTNNPWSFSVEETRRQLGISRLHVVNDFTALALSVPHLPDDELQKVGGGEAVEQHAIGIVGAGTGLGVSGLIPCGSHWTALQGEGGHVTMSLRTDREFAVYRKLHERFRHVSAERFLSGPGLRNIVESLQAIDGLEVQPYTPADITRLALEEGDPYCLEAMEMFASLLGNVASNLVLTLGAEGGLFIGGGVVPRFGEWFAQSAFRESFEDKGRMRTYVEKVPTFVIHSPYPALVGAARLLV